VIASSISSVSSSRSVSGVTCHQWCVPAGTRTSILSRQMFDEQSAKACRLSFTYGLAAAAALTDRGNWCERIAEIAYVAIIRRACSCAASGACAGKADE
jgi:hypothetical protein